MIKKYLFLIFIIVSTVNCLAQEQPAFDGHKYNPPYFLDTPQHWGIERFLIPIQFAPTIPYKGIEDIRFTPGWAKKESGDYWSYVFLWYLDGAVKMDETTIKKNLIAYYTGLMRANADSARASTIADAEVSVIKKTGNSFEATVNTLDYMTWQPMILNIRIHLQPCTAEKKTFVLHLVSPKPHSHAVWEKLDKLRTTFRCKK